MTKQDQPDQRVQSRDLTRRYSPQGLLGTTPFSLMRRMSEEMERVLGEFGMKRGETANAAWAPAIEISQGEGKYLVRAEIPGVKPSDVKLEVTDDAVILEGERKEETQENKGGVQVTERHYGHFYRAIPLPEGAKVDEAKARFENGVLEVTVPMQASKEKRRQIPIEPAAPVKAA